VKVVCSKHSAHASETGSPGDARPKVGSMYSSGGRCAQNVHAASVVGAGLGASGRWKLSGMKPMKVGLLIGGSGVDGVRISLATARVMDHPGYSG
jgi:hypothetical protein